MLINDENGIRLISFYLPQYHPIPENDAWWGKGFTEWTNVTRARPRFPGHYQPHLPADLGFYDLRLPETRQSQADLAREYGISGFCYHHYWFSGQQLLERPFGEVLASGEPDFPFCLCWANHNWTKRWDGFDQEVLQRQTYSAEDDINHIRHLASAFADKRYIRVGGKPLFLVYRSTLLPDAMATTDRWREEAHRMGLGELFLCRVESHDEGGDPRRLGFDAAVEFQPRYDKIIRLHSIWYYRFRRYRFHRKYDPRLVFDYEEYVKRILNDPPANYPRFPCVCPAWDNSARMKAPLIMVNSTPEAYKKWLRTTLERAKPVGGDDVVVFINAWNEWAEGNHLEPCQKWGRAYLEATREALSEARSATVNFEEGLPAR